MSAKYFKRGTREYYMVSPEKVIRIVNKQYRSDVTIFFHAVATVTDDALEGKEIERSEFEKEFEVASRLIVLEP